MFLKNVNKFTVCYNVLLFKTMLIHKLRVNVFVYIPGTQHVYLAVSVKYSDKNHIKTRVLVNRSLLTLQTL